MCLTCLMRCKSFNDFTRIQYILTPIVYIHPSNKGDTSLTAVCKVWYLGRDGGIFTIKPYSKY